MGTINIGAGGGGVPGYSPVIETKLVANSQIDTKLSQGITMSYGGETSEGEFLARTSQGEQVLYSKYCGPIIIGSDTGNANTLAGLSSGGDYMAYMYVAVTNSYSAWLNIYNRKLGCYVRQSSAALSTGTDRTWITGFDSTNPDIVYVIGKTSTVSLFKYVISTGVLTTVNTAVPLNTSHTPTSMVCDGTNIYVNCTNAFYKLDMTGALVTTVTNTDTTGNIFVLPSGNFLLCGFSGWSKLRLITKSTFASTAVTTKSYICLQLFENNLYAIPLDSTRGYGTGNFVILNQSNLAETVSTVSTYPYPIQHYGGSAADASDLTKYRVFGMSVFRNIGLYTTNLKSTLYTFELENVITGYRKL